MRESAFLHLALEASGLVNGLVALSLFFAGHHRHEFVFWTPLGAFPTQLVAPDALHHRLGNGRFSLTPTRYWSSGHSRSLRHVRALRSLNCRIVCCLSGLAFSRQ